MPLFKFEWDCGRHGNLVGVFSADQEDVDALIGEDVYFGEVLGKHSEVYGVIELADITKLTDDEAFITTAIECGLVPTGFNPLEYRHCHNCNETEYDRLMMCDECGGEFCDECSPVRDDDAPNDLCSECCG